MPGPCGSVNAADYRKVFFSVRPDSGIGGEA